MTTYDQVSFCPYCSNPPHMVSHSGPCPLIKAIEYHPNGQVKRVEFHSLEPFRDRTPYPYTIGGGGYKSGGTK